MKNKIFSAAVFLYLATACIFGGSKSTLAEEDSTSDSNLTFAAYLPIVVDGVNLADCTMSQLGSILFTELTSGESTGPYLEGLAREGYYGLAGTPTFDLGAQYFDNLSGWEGTLICNTLDCLEQRAERAFNEGLDYKYLSYGPERLDGVPDEEKYNLPWATQIAREIANEWNKPLMISYSTRQLHQEAEERGYDWDDPSAVVAMLAPYGDAWMIQAADEYWLLEDYSVRPILSQRVYPPGKEFRAQVERWVNWIRTANPDIEIWIQLAMQRIGVDGANYPSADLLLEYRESIADLVDGVYMMPIYGSIDQFPTANQEMVDVFHRACDVQSTETTKTDASIVTNAIETLSPSISIEDITLVEEGWTDDLTIPCSPSGDCLTILPGYYYRIYENTQFPCGSQGNHQFIVLDNSLDMQTPKHLFAKFPGGAVGFWYINENDERIYYPNELAVGLLTSSYFRNMFFRTLVSEEYANGVTKRFRENADFRIIAASYCSHDLYHGSGEYNEVDGFSRWGYSAAMQAVQFVQQHYETRQVVTYGGSAGAAGAFYVGKNLSNVSAIIMDSQAVDLSAISEACYDGYNVFGSSYPCFCPDGGQSCMEVLAPRIGFDFYSDEPYKFVEAGFNKPIYYLWNERDASIYAHLQFEKLHNTIEQYNPGGSSIANMVCITDPRTPPGPICNLHVPSAYDFPETESLVEEIYNWGLEQVGKIHEILEIKTHIPFIVN